MERRCEEYMKKITFALFLSLAMGYCAMATTLSRMDLDDLTAESHAVVHGKIVASRTEWDKNHNVIYTFYTVQPLEYLKGNLGPSFELQELGGERDGLVMTVASVPVFTVGDETVLFVWTDAQGRHQVIGFEQGSLKVQTDAQTGQKTVDRAIRLGSARSAVSGASPAPATSRSLPQLFNQIRSSAAKAPKAGAAQ